MANNCQLSNEAANAESDAVARKLDGGFFRLYSGTQPANGDASLGSAVLLATLTFAATSAPASVGGVATFTPLGAGTAVATGTASFYRCFKSDGVSPVMDGSVGTASANCILGTTAIQQGAQVTNSSFSYTAAKATTGY